MAPEFKKSWLPGCDNSDGANYCHAITVAQEFAAVDELSALPRAVQLPGVPSQRSNAQTVVAEFRAVVDILQYGERS